MEGNQTCMAIRKSRDCSAYISFKKKLKSQKPLNITLFEGFFFLKKPSKTSLTINEVAYQLGGQLSALFDCKLKKNAIFVISN